VAGSTLLLLATFTNALLAGFLLALPVVLRPLLMERPGVNNRYAQLLPAAVRILLVPLMLATALLIDKWVVSTVLVAGALMAALALVTVERGGALSSFASFAGTAAMLAGAAAALFNASIVLMPQAFFPGNAARSINLGFVAIAAGAMTAPLLTPLLVRRLEMNKTLLVLACACLIPAALVACTPAEQLVLKPVTAERGDLMHDPRIVLLFLATALAFPLEAFLAPWVRRFVCEHAHLPGSSMVLSGGFWLAFLGSRLAAALILPDAGTAWLVLVLTMLAAITLGNLIGAYAPGSAGLALVITGACCGPLVPTLLGLVVQSNPGEIGPVVGCANAAGALSIVLLVPWVDASRPGRSTRAAMRGAMALAVLLMAPALVLALIG
jgi:hypothetical protein